MLFILLLLANRKIKLYPLSDLAIKGHQVTVSLNLFILHKKVNMTLSQIAASLICFDGELRVVQQTADFKILC